MARHDLSVSRRGFASGALSLALGTAARELRAEPPSEALRAASATALGELARHATKLGMRLSACVADAASGQVLAEAASHDVQNPASNQKLLTMAVALDRLGPNHRFTTALLGRASGDGNLSELVLRSNGDPELSTATLEQLVRGLVDQGVRRINGDVWVDQSAFDSNWDPPAYELHPDEWAAYRAPVSAVSVNGNSVTLHVLGVENSVARSWLTPPGVASLSGEVLTGAAQSPQNVRYSVRPRGDELEVLVGGSVPSGRGELTFTRRIAQPELAPGRVLALLLREHGVSVAGQLRAGGADVQAERVSQRSRSLAEIIHALGKHSDNFVAEMLLKALGASDKSGPGSSAKGARLIEEYLNRVGGLDSGTRIGNGSGLYDANRVSAFGIVRALVATFNDVRLAPEFIAALSIGGLDGTLSQRFKTHRAERSVRAKTGTLADATALSGYLLRGRTALAFSLVVNGVAGKQLDARARIDAAIETILRA
ncbi:MAG: D-alanyl-D-alanine carboxypeptidase/D-alanyl-D-alanine endopeptidase [Myxococcota bacterium]